MFLWQITPPAIEPVTLEEVKLHLRIDGNEEDSYLLGLITAARQRCEEYTRRAFISQKWEFALDGAVDMIYLPRPPVEMIESVTLDGEEVDPANYTLLAANVFYPKVPLKVVNPGGLVIRYTSGYGDNAEHVPKQIRQAILMLIGHLYEAREGQAPQIQYEVQARTGADMPPSVISLLRPYRVMML